MIKICISMSLVTASVKSVLLGLQWYNNHDYKIKIIKLCNETHFCCAKSQHFRRYVLILGRRECITFSFQFRHKFKLKSYLLHCHDFLCRLIKLSSLQKFCFSAKKGNHHFARRKEGIICHIKPWSTSWKFMFSIWEVLLVSTLARSSESDTVCH